MHVIMPVYCVLTVHVSSVLLLLLVTCLVAARRPGGHLGPDHGAHGSLIFTSAPLLCTELLVTLTITHWLRQCLCPWPLYLSPVLLTVSTMTLRKVWPGWAGRPGLADHGTGWEADRPLPAWQYFTSHYTQSPRLPVVVKLRGQVRDRPTLTCGYFGISEYW